MNATVVMIILTMLPNGDISSSFVNIDTQEECIERLERIRPILESSESTETREAGCFRSAAEFTYFDHDPPKDAQRHDLLVSLDGEQASVSRQQNAEDCRQALERLPPPEAGQRHYCTTSTQDMTESGE
ncbi:hypothetical protein KYK29_14945 [Shinella daejeonensis]|uniref:hypothetical protein n=1 Tax=Shinella daejeonensis TaxID=659017 RepID=UPI0020C7E537|nr:hypothetical protein [Shinella daejeonensis]MCP8896227.1 hypothetical protein [Shinella daejeonensis]